MGEDGQMSLATTSASRRQLPGGTCIGRDTRIGSTVWGNPYKVTPQRSRERCVQLCEDYLKQQPKLLGQLPELAGAALCCHCPSDQMCHADTIIRVFRDRLRADPRLESNAASKHRQEMRTVRLSMTLRCAVRPREIMQQYLSRDISEARAWWQWCRLFTTPLQAPAGPG